MKPDQIADALEVAAGQLAIKVRYETLPQGGLLGGGGLCRVHGHWNLIIDKKATPAERVAVMTNALARFDTETVFLPPKVREVLQVRKAPLAIPVPVPT